MSPSQSVLSRNMFSFAQVLESLAELLQPYHAGCLVHFGAEALRVHKASDVARAAVQICDTYLRDESVLSPGGELECVEMHLETSLQVPGSCFVF